MKNILFYLIIIIVFSITNLFAQDTTTNKISSKPIFLIYSNFHHTISKNATGTNFDIRRAYLGYEFNFGNEFLGYIKIDIGSPDERLNYSLLRRNAYFRNVGIAYTTKSTRIDFGIIDNFQHKIQEKFWGRRYIFASFLNEYDFIQSTDLGIKITQKLFNSLICNLSITNGEYDSNQTGFKRLTYSAGFDYLLKNYLVFRLFSSYSGNLNNKFTSGIFVGYSYLNKFNIAAETNITNTIIENENFIKYGYSFFSSFSINKKFNLLLRYDILNSNIPEGNTIPWNLSNDGSALIGGIEYKYNDNVRFSLNYQDWYPYASNLTNLSYIYFNIEFGIFESNKRI